MDLFNNLDVIHKSRPPLRWIANLSGEISGWAILRIAYLDEDNNFGFRYKLLSAIFKLFNPMSMKYGTFYQLNIDLSGKGWDDYDEDGVPYWEKYNLDWDYEDPETGDGFRIITKREE